MYQNPDGTITLSVGPYGVQVRCEVDPDNPCETCDGLGYLDGPDGGRCPDCNLP